MAVVFEKTQDLGALIRICDDQYALESPEALARKERAHVLTVWEISKQWADRKQAGDICPPRDGV